MDRSFERLATISRLTHGHSSVRQIANPPEIAPPATLLIVSLIVTSVFAAAQVGKAIISMPYIKTEMHLGLDIAGLIVAVFATIGALGGIGAGAVVVRIGLQRSLIGGLVAMAFGNLLGSHADNAETLLIARIIEGIGFFGAILAVPSLLARLLNDHNRNFVMALWSAFMPGGIMLMLFFAPALPSIGWRSLWLASAIAASLLAIFWCTKIESVLKTGATNIPTITNSPYAVKNVVAVLGQRQCVAAAFAFFAYSCQMFSMIFALPHFLTSTYTIAIETAGLISGAILAVSTAGHVVSGFLLRAGLKIWISVAIALLTFAILSICIYSTLLPAPVAIILAAISLGVGGLAPGALFASGPKISPTAENLPTTIGLLQQGSNLGQLAGPMMVGALAEQFGWPSAALAVVPIAVAGCLACLMLRGKSKVAALRTA